MYNKQILHFNHPTEDPTDQLHQANNGFQEVRFSPDEKIVTTCNNHSTHVYNLNVQKQRVLSIFRSKTDVRTIEYSINTTDLILGGSTGALTLVDCKTTQQKFYNRFHQNWEITQMKQMSENTVLTSDRFGNINRQDFRDPTSSKTLFYIPGRGDETFGVLSDGTTMVISNQQTILLWDIRQLNKRIMELKGHQNNITICKVHPTRENIIVTGSFDKTLREWDIKTQTSKCIYNGDQIWFFTKMLLIPDSTQIIFSTRARSIDIIDCKDEQQPKNILQSIDYVSSIDMTQSKQLVVGYIGAQVSVFNI